jgi:hypothetical protein
MENFEELQKVIAHKEKVEEYIKRIKTLGYVGNCGNKYYVGIKDDHNLRYTFEGLGKIIGQDKLDSIVGQFEGLINVELQRSKEKVEIELSEFKIVKE